MTLDEAIARIGLDQIYRDARIARGWKFEVPGVRGSYGLLIPELANPELTLEQFEQLEALAVDALHSFKMLERRGAVN